MEIESTIESYSGKKKREKKVGRTEYQPRSYMPTHLSPTYLRQVHLESQLYPGAIMRPVVHLFPPRSSFHAIVELTLADSNSRRARFFCSGASPSPRQK